MEVYIARDKNGKVFIYNCKPEKGGDLWLNFGMFFPIIDLPEGVNPQWEDNEPIKVNLKIEKL